MKFLRHLVKTVCGSQRKKPSHWQVVLPKIWAECSQYLKHAHLPQEFLHATLWTWLLWGHAPCWRSEVGPGLRSVDFFVMNHVFPAKLRKPAMWTPVNLLSCMWSSYVIYPIHNMSCLSPVLYVDDSASRAFGVQFCVGGAQPIAMKSLPNIVCHLVAMAAPAETSTVYSI